MSSSKVLHSGSSLGFGPFRFETRPYSLTRDGEGLSLTPQQAQLLELLVRHSGEVVSRRQIREILWSPSVHVDFDRSINFCVARLRAVLDDRGGQPRFIETVPRRGYCFVAAVETFDRQSDAVEALGAGTQRARWAWWSRPVLAGWSASGLALTAAALAAAALVVTTVSLSWAPSQPAQASPDGGLTVCQPEILGSALDAAARFEFRRACHLAIRGWSSDRPQVVGALEAVLADHPNFVPALSSLATVHALSADWRRAEPFAALAVSFEPAGFEGLAVAAKVNFRYRFDWPRAEEILRRALELKPEDISLRVELASLLSAWGRHQEAVALARETAVLDPFSIRAKSELAEELYLAKHYEEAVEVAAEVVGLDPRYIEAQRYLIHSRIALGHTEAALEQANLMLKPWGWGRGAADSLEEFWRLNLEHDTFIGSADQNQHSERAYFALAAGDRQQAIERMRQACAQRSGWSLPYYDIDPRFAPLRQISGLESLSRCLDHAGVELVRPEGT